MAAWILIIGILINLDLKSIEPWNPLIVTLYYTMFEMVVIVSALWVFGKYKVAQFLLLFSIYLNTPFIICYSGGLNSYNFMVLLFLPFGVFQLTKSLSFSLIGAVIGLAETLYIYHMHMTGWDFKGNAIITSTHSQFALNILVLCITDWMFSLIYARGLNKAAVLIAESKRAEMILTISNRIIREFEIPLQEITQTSKLIENNTSTSEQTIMGLNNINRNVLRMSSIIADLREHDDA